MNKIKAYPIINVEDLAHKSINGYNKKRYVKNIKYIMIHHTGSNKMSIENLIHSHTVSDHKWPNVGYHFFIRKNEYIYQTASLNDIVNGCKDFNSNTIHICFEGNFQYDDVLFDFDGLLDTILNYLPSHCKSLPILMHMEKRNTLCPGTNLVKYVTEYRDRRKLKNASLWPDLE